LSSETLLLADSVLFTTSLSLLLELLLTLNFGLLFVDGLDKDVLVLVLVTLGSGIHAMVHSPVDFLGVTIPSKESAENTGAAHPDELRWHTGVLGSLPATVSKMTSFPLS